VLVSLDAQSHPTQFAVRAGAGNLTRVELDGFVLWLDADDCAVSAVIAHQRDWEPHVSAALRSVLAPGAHFVDVGANVGFHTYMAASIVGAHGSVMAVEASAENCRLLQLSKFENDANNVVLLPVALDQQSGAVYLTSHIGTNAGLIGDTFTELFAARGTTVYATTLDDIAPSRVDVMKIDVEGAEFRVLEGARKTLERDRPVIVMEFSCEMSQRVSRLDPVEALQGVRDLGYRLFVLERETGERQPFPSAARLLDDWGDPLRLEDLLLLPD
jgi:FkbM family methyltransferase